MEPIVIVRNQEPEEFMYECAKLVKDGYVLSSSNCACTGECHDEMYQAIFCLPSVLKERKKER